MLPKYRFSTRILIFDKKLLIFRQKTIFEQKFEYRTKILIFGLKFNFPQNSNMRQIKVFFKQ